MAPRLMSKTDDMSTWDLLGYLEYMGWAFKVWFSKADKPCVVEVQERAPMIFWAKPDTIVISHFYLLALAKIEQIKKEYISHFQKDAYYKRLLSGNNKLSISGDMDAIPQPRQPPGGSA
eukprot:2301190-Pyramimonas_sp.AAC.1